MPDTKTAREVPGNTSLMTNNKEIISEVMQDSEELYFVENGKTFINNDCFAKLSTNVPDDLSALPEGTIIPNDPIDIDAVPWPIVFKLDCTFKVGDQQRDTITLYREPVTGDFEKTPLDEKGRITLGMCIPIMCLMAKTDPMFIKNIPARHTKLIRRFVNIFLGNGI